MSDPVTKTNGAGSPLDQVVNALLAQDIEDADRQLIGRLVKELAERKAERDRLREELADAHKTIAGLQERLANIERKRAAYWEALKGFLGPAPEFTEEEIIELERTGVTSEQILADLREVEGK